MSLIVKYEEVRQVLNRLTVKNTHLLHLKTLLLCSRCDDRIFRLVVEELHSRLVKGSSTTVK